MRVIRTCCALAAGLLVTSTARADPIVLRPVSFIEIVDHEPIDGASLRQEISENVALGPSDETRVFYQFAIPPLRSAPPAVVFSVVRRPDVFSECASLAPCPDLARLDVFGYAGSGTIALADYGAGALLASITSIPGRGRTISVNVTDFVDGLLADDGGFAGFILRPGSRGALGVSNARLAATPEPGSLTLVMIGGVAATARSWRRCKR